jgi:hypothetical protein
MKPIYQYLYDNIEATGYGATKNGPGIRMFPYIKDFLKNIVYDMGCGNGDTVEYLREKGFEVCGIDWIKHHPGMQMGDITKPLDMKPYNTAIAMDVFEHLDNKQVIGLIENMTQCERQVFSIANAPSIVEKDGKEIDLHINQKPFDVWDGIIQDYFDIVEKYQMRPYSVLYLTRRKKNLVGRCRYCGK